MTAFSPVVLATFEPTLKKTIQLGKFDIDNRRRPVYRLDLDPAHQMVILDAFGIAPCVVRVMEAESVKVIHYHIKGEEQVYEAHLEDVLKYGILKAFGVRSKYYHLPKDYWRKVPNYRMQFVRQVRTLLWTEPEPEKMKPKPEQLGLAI